MYRKMMSLSVIMWFSGKPVADGVKPVTSPAAPLATATYLKVISPLVKVLGLCSCMLVVILSHWVKSTGIGKIRGVGSIVTTTVWLGPSLQPTGLTGVIV